MMIKGPRHQKDITNINVNMPNKRASKYMKQKTEFKRERDTFIVVVGDFNTPLSVTNKTTSP